MTRTSFQEYGTGRGVRRIQGVGRAVTESRQERQDSAGPLPVGRGHCPSCWRDFPVNWTGVVRAHTSSGFRCRGGAAVVFEGPLPAPKPSTRGLRTPLPVVHVAAWGTVPRTVCGKAGSDTDLNWGEPAPDGTRLCGFCARKTS